MTDQPSVSDSGSALGHGLRSLASRPVFIIAAVAFAMIADHVVLGPFSFLEWHDVGDSTFSRYAAIAGSLADHGIYYWYPYMGAGMDLLANELRFFDIFTISFALLPDWLALAGLRFMQYFVAGWFTYRVCHEDMGLSRSAGVAAGLIFLFAQSNVMELYFGFSVLPFIVWALERIHRRSGWTAWALAAALGCAYSFVATINHGFLFSLPVAFVWLIVVRRLYDERFILMFAVFGIFCFALQADMIFAMLSNVALSQRSQLAGTGTIKSFVGSGDMLRLATPLALALFAAYERRWRSTPTAVLAVAVFFLAITEFDEPVREAAAWFVEAVRGLKLDRFKHALPFIVAVGAACGLDAVGRAAAGAMPARRRLTVVLAYATLLPVLWMPAKEITGNLRDWIQWGGHAAYFRSPAMQALAGEQRSGRSPFRVVTVHENGLLPAVANAYGLEAADGYTGMISLRYRRYWNLVTEPFLLRNFGQAWTVPDGTNHLRLLSDDAHGLTIDAKDYFRVNLLALANVRYVLTNVPLNSPDLALLPETKPDRFWDDLSRDEKIEHRVRENFVGRHVMIYRNRAALPRWFFADQVAFFAGDDEFGARMADTPAAGLAQTALFADAHADSLANFTDQSKGAATIKPVRYAPDEIVLAVATAERRVLIVANSFSPYWRCRVDGVDVAILPAYDTFWGVPLSAGRHTVRFTYEPPYKIF